MFISDKKYICLHKIILQEKLLWNMCDAYAENDIHVWVLTWFAHDLFRKMCSIARRAGGQQEQNS